MDKSKYGLETTYLWNGCLTEEQTSVIEVASTLHISDADRKQLTEAFEQAKVKNPNFFDGTLWRYEGHNAVRGGIEFLVSPTTYLPHNIRRLQNFSMDYQNGRFVSEHVNPFAINAIQETEDGYLLIGVKGGKSDQVGLGVMGAGFVKRQEERMKSLPPKNIFTETLRECLEETSYANNTAPTESNIEEFRLLGTIWGSNHDTTTAVYVPLHSTSKEVDLGNQEHTDLWLLPTDEKSLQRFLDEGGMKGANAVDHLLGDVELYMNARKKELIGRKK